ncbi:MAG: ribose 5-phosphate isomerase B [Bryobacter sp.]|jgi:ribose 5-phosphate isomerase B|nr:ribose 5-phosphate isomerase B [Bryobacter sp.]
MRHVITAQDIPFGGELAVPRGSIVTPAARELAAERGVHFREVEHVPEVSDPHRIVVIGADHGGFALKQSLKPVLEGLGYRIEDVGTHDGSPADYPDIAFAVAEKVASGFASRGVIVDGAGIGSAMAANKVPGIRAALCYDQASARNSREHNHANVLTLGGRLLTLTQAEDVLRTWMATPYGGGRHQKRIDKIHAIERRYAP